MREKHKMGEKIVVWSTHLVVEASDTLRDLQFVGRGRPASIEYVYREKVLQNEQNKHTTE